MKILPETAVPQLAVDTVGGGTWDLSQREPASLTVLFFYRGHH